MKKINSWIKLSISFFLLLNIAATSDSQPNRYAALDIQACPAGQLPLFMAGTCTGGGAVRASINTAIADASDGWTVWLDAGAFNENVVIDKRITLRGVGSGANAASNTIITSTTAAQSTLQVTVPGTIAQPITIMNLHVTGAFGGSGNNESGIHLRGAGIQNITIDNVAVVNNAGRGIAVDTGGGDALNITVRDSDLSNNGLQGFRIPLSAASATGLLIENCTIDNNAQAGIEVSYAAGEPREITVIDTTLSGNGGAAAPGGGNGGIILYQYSGAVAGNDIIANFTNVTITGPAALGADTSGFYINARTSNTTPGIYNFNNVEVNGNHVYDIRFRRFADMGGISMNNVRSLGTSSYGVVGVTVGGTLALGNTQFSNTHATFDTALIDADGDINALSAAFLGAATLANVQDRVSDSLPTGVGIVIIAAPDIAGPQVTSTTLSAVMQTGPTQTQVTFNEDVQDVFGDTGADDATNPANYLLIQPGNNGVFNTATCLGGLAGDDLGLSIDNVTYNNSTYKSTVAFNGGTALPDGTYRFLVCGTTSIADIWNNPLNDGVDFSFDFTVGEVLTNQTETGSALPDTGFPQGVETVLPLQPAAKSYTALGDLWLEIPSLGVELPIVGVPVVENEWDVQWLTNQVGYLGGTAFPTWAGNTVLTAHVWDASNNPGPFVNLNQLQHGDEFFIHAFGQIYTYAVQDTLQVSPDNLTALAHAEYDRVTLMTCEVYDAQTDAYIHRRVVIAVLVAIAIEN